MRKVLFAIMASITALVMFTSLTGCGQKEGLKTTITEQVKDGSGIMKLETGYAVHNATVQQSIQTGVLTSKKAFQVALKIDDAQWQALTIARLAWFAISSTNGSPSPEGLVALQINNDAAHASLQERLRALINPLPVA